MDVLESLAIAQRFPPPFHDVMPEEFPFRIAYECGAMRFVKGGDGGDRYVQMLFLAGTPTSERPPTAMAIFPQKCRAVELPETTRKRVIASFANVDHTFVKHIYRERRSSIETSQSVYSRCLNIFQTLALAPSVPLAKVR
jgi:hypothetical protein